VTPKVTLPDANATLAKQTEDFYDALSELIRVYQFRDRDRICCHDVSISQCYALEALARRGPLTLNELAAYLYLDKSTTSRVVDALERKGLLRRTDHPDDKRSVQLVATTAGRQRHRLIMRDIHERERGLLAEFTPEVRTSIIDVIARLASAAAQRVETTGGVCCCLD
jgi:MarR family transcriptional regulator, 2-MHQ and catechol-resistance regulon repressor